ncbi:hypothetical protein [Klebsiella pneumoniae]
MLASGTGPPSRLFRRAQAADQDIDGKDYPGE